MTFSPLVKSVLSLSLVGLFNFASLAHCSCGFELLFLPCRFLSPLWKHLAHVVVNLCFLGVADACWHFLIKKTFFLLVSSVWSVSFTTVVLCRAFIFPNLGITTSKKLDGKKPCHGKAFPNACFPICMILLMYVQDPFSDLYRTSTGPFCTSTGPPSRPLQAPPFPNLYRFLSATVSDFDSFKGDVVSPCFETAGLLLDVLNMFCG